MIRTTLACFAAAAGGADAITVSPFDSAIGVPDALGLRIARNTQLLLREESHIHQVIDPAGGSYYVESLTDSLAMRAWGLFQELEAGSGPSLSERIDATHEARSRDVATRKVPLTGVSEFPDLDEALVERPQWPDDSDMRRLAEPFEDLRDAAEGPPEVVPPEYSNATEGLPVGLWPRPSVFLANLGPVAVHTARSSFAANLLAAGGIATVVNEGFDTPADAAAAWESSDSSVAVVCSSDKVYEEHAAATVAALRKAGCGYVLLAGRRDDFDVDADDYVHLGCDALAALKGIHEKLDLPAPAPAAAKG